jgi:mannonate dehydratase
MLKPENYQFARQCGCTDLIIHLAEYYENEIVTATDENRNYGESRAHDSIWELDSLLKIKKDAGEFGLNIYGIENFSPADWYDILLDGPEKHNQMAYLKQVIRNVGKAGIKSVGYNFSLAGVWGHQKKNAARGGALTTCFNADELCIDTPIPKGQIWNMTYGANTGTGYIKEIDEAELWERFRWFLKELLPVAEKAGVEMALHPDDPPMPRLRKTPRLVYRPELYQKAIEIVPSAANKLELCLGSLQEMQGEDIYTATERYLAQGKIAYVHFRNVKGKVPNYIEVFVDEGDIDMLRILRLMEKYHFEGVLIPDHTPLMTCDSPWHAGMAYAIGYIQAALRHLQGERA